MTVRVIDRDEAISLLEKQVEKKGAGHKSQCIYFDSLGEPQCIIGHVLDDLGFTKGDLYGCNGTTFYAIVTGDIKMYMDNPFDGRVEFTNMAAEVLIKAQNVQDEGRTWGEALEAVR